MLAQGWPIEVRGQDRPGLANRSEGLGLAHGWPVRSWAGQPGWDRQSWLTVLVHLASHPMHTSYWGKSSQVAGLGWPRASLTDVTVRRQAEQGWPANRASQTTHQAINQAG